MNARPGVLARAASRLGDWVRRLWHRYRRRRLLGRITRLVWAPVSGR